MSDQDPASLSPQLPPAGEELFGRREPWGPVASLAWTGLVLLVHLVVPLLVTLVQLALSDGSRTLLQVASSGFGLSLGLLVATPLSTGAIVLLVRWRGAGVRRELGLVPPSAAQLLGWAAATASVVVLFEVAGRLLDRPPLPPFMREVYATAGWLPLLYLSFVVMAPLFEEVAFRGFLLPRLADSALGTTGAVVVTATLWTVIHPQYDAFDLTGVFALGVVFGAARVTTGSLWVPLALHAAVNLAAVVQTAWLVGGP